MTAKSSQHLADTLRAAGFEALAGRAERDEFHDFLSEVDFPEMALDAELVTLIESGDESQRTAARHIRRRHHDGEFDASKQESDDWADSPDGREAFRLLAKGE